MQNTVTTNARQALPSLIKHFEAIDRFIDKLLEQSAPAHIHGSKALKRWRTIHEPVSRAKLLKALEGNPNYIIGLRWDGLAWWITIDIDKGSRYHGRKARRKLIAHLADIGLKASTYRSSYSGGFHLICPLTKPEDCGELQSIIQNYLESLGYAFELGQLEIYPNANRQCVRVPCQNGSGWESRDYKEPRLYKDRLVRFMRQLKTDAADWDVVRSNYYKLAIPEIPKRPERYSGYCSLQGTARVEGKELALSVMKSGLVGYGQTHSVILGLSALFWDGDSANGIARMARDSEGIATAIFDVMSRGHNGFSRTFNRGGAAALWEECRRAAYWRPHDWVELSERLTKAWQKYPVPQRVREAANRNSAVRARLSIEKALLDFRDEYRAEPSTEMLSEASGRDWETCKKHYEDIKEDELNDIPLLSQRRRMNEQAEEVEMAVPLTEKQAHALCDKYPDGLVLWDEFWQFMAKQMKEGASDEYHKTCQKVLEKVWRSRGGQHAWEVESQKPEVVERLHDRALESMAKTPLEYLPVKQEAVEPAIPELAPRRVPEVAEHMEHIRMRLSDKTFWEDKCEACRLHKSANNRRHGPIIPAQRVEQARERYEQK